MKSTLYKFLFLVTLVFSCGSVQAAVLSKPANNLGLVAYWSFDEGTSTTAGDFSGNGNMGALTSMENTDWVAGKRGKALDFDGSDEHISIPAQTQTAIGALTHDFTVSAWINPDSLSNGTIVSHARTTNNGFRITTQSNGTILFTTWNVKDYIGTVSALSAGKWQHVVVTLDANDDASFYVNGVFVETVTHTAPALVNSDDVFMIGAATVSLSSTLTSLFNGKIDDVRIYNRTLTASEISALYQRGSGVRKVSSDTGLVGYWPFDEGTSTKAGDFSGYKNNGTLTGAGGLPIWTNGKHGKALFFDGVDDWVDTITQPAIQIGPNVFTVSAFIKPGNQNSRFITPNSNGIDQYIQYDPSTRSIGFGITEIADVNNRLRTSTTGSVPVGVWTHWAISINNKNIKIYINGVLDSEYNESIDIADWTGNWAVGQRSNSTFWYLGSLDDLRVYNRVLSATEIFNLYQSNASTINSSQNTRLTSGLVGFWSFNGPDITSNDVVDVSGNGNRGGFIGGATSTAKVAGKVGQALNFDGVDDYVVTPSLNLSATSAATVSFWYLVKIQAITTEVALEFSTNFNNVTTGFMVATDDATSCSPDAAAGLKGNTGYNLACYTRPSLGWHHYVAVFDKSLSSNEANLYIDGILQTPTSRPFNSNNTNSFGTLPLYFMTRAGSSLFNDGSIDEVRVYNRALSSSEVLQLYNMGK
jgi:hypothetical protein